MSNALESMQVPISVKPKFKLSLGIQIMIALVLGVMLGAYLHGSENQAWVTANILNPAGQLFIKMIKMIVVPIVISTLIVGIAGVGDAKKLGGLGFKTIVYFEIITTVAIIVGIALANIFQPGTGIDIGTLAAGDISQYMATTEQVSQSGHAVTNVILSVVPSNIIQSMANTDMLAVIFFAVIFGLGLCSLPDEKKQPLLDVMQAISSTMFKVTNMIMLYAPIGVFALISATVAAFGFSSLIPLLKLVVLVYAAIIFFAVVILGGVGYLFKINIFHLIIILKDELILAYSTSSSETVLPRIMEKMEKYGAPNSVTSFVIPIGYSFNLDGSTLYQSIAAIFICQLFNFPLTLGDQVILVATLMLTSKGIAGVPGVSFVVLLATLSVLGNDNLLQGLAFIAGVDRILDMARTALNVVGNALAAIIIAKMDKSYDDKKGREYYESGVY